MSLIKLVDVTHALSRKGAAQEISENGLPTGPDTKIEPLLTAQSHARIELLRQRLDELRRKRSRRGGKIVVLT